MLAVAIGAVRGPLIPCFQGLSMDALVIGDDDFTVALATGVRHLKLADKRFWIAADRHVMSTMTVAAGRSLQIAACERHAMNALLVASDKAGGKPDFISHLWVVEVAFEAGIRLFGLVQHRFRLGHRNDNVRPAVAVQACGSPLGTLRK